MTPRRLLVVSHPAVIGLNQVVYRELAYLGWDLTLVVPDRWEDPYHGRFRTQPLPELREHVRLIRTARPGDPARHVYLVRAGRLIDALRPDVAFLEEEGFAVPALQWGSALARRSVPFGVQADENLDRRLPAAARFIRDRVLPRAAFVAARSPAAEVIARGWGARGLIAVVPHTVASWDVAERTGPPEFTVGYAGRLVAEKGLDDLLTAASRLPGPVKVLIVGDGPLRSELEHRVLANGTVEVRTGVTHEHMRSAYAEMDVVVLPSRSTPTWTEQFGRVLVEAAMCGRPVVGSDSGEIGWVIGAMEAGRVFPEGDVGALTEVLGELQASPSERARLAAAGHAGAVRLFSVEAAALALHGLLDRVAAPA